MWIKLLFVVVNLLVNFESPNVDIIENQPAEVIDSNSFNRDSESNTNITPTRDSESESSTNSSGNITPSNQDNEESKPEVKEPAVITEIETPSSDDFINLHLMIASHTDAGWIHTFEKYYQGTNSQDGGCVKCILNNMMDSLPKNKERKYDMSEISFFKRWWSDQSEDRRNAFKHLVQDRQFDFINGAWVANDEATAYYEDIMDNFILGHRWLQDNLGLDSLVGWQVDSFGNSATQAGLMAQAGYEGLFFSRADYIDRETRRAQKSLQFNWAPPNPHNESVFTQMLYVSYSDTKFMIPDNFYCRSIFCRGRLTPDGFKKVGDYVKLQQKSFKTKNILFLVCDDFLLTKEAEKDYDGAEDLIRYFNTHPEIGIKAKFSHLSDYLAQVTEDLLTLEHTGERLPVKHDDTFPYVEKQGHVWTGYFTSKPMFKLMVREYSEYYNAVKLFLAKMLLLNDKDILPVNQEQQNNLNQALNSIEEPLAIVQHHDAVSGTMKEFVRSDYERMLKEGRQALENTLQPIMLNYLKSQINEVLTPSSVTYDWLYRDEAYEHIFEPGKTPVFAIFNPGSTRNLLVKVKIPISKYILIDDSNTQVEVDTICHSEDNNSDCYIYFVTEFAAYSAKVYRIIASENEQKLAPSQIDSQGRNVFSDKGMNLNVQGNLLDFNYEFCLNQTACAIDSFNLDYEYYQSGPQPNKAPSGAYVFTPGPDTKYKYSTIKYGRVFNGKYLSMIQIFRDNVRTDMKVLYHQPTRGIEIDSYLEPLDVNPNGKEVVLIVRSNTIRNTDNAFYTDANGYFMQKRVKNHKDNFQLAISEGININYYPITSNIYIEDTTSGKRLSLVTDRAQGASSLNQGEIEIMIHRTTTKDDWKGVGEPLQERYSQNRSMIRVTTRHYLSYSNPKLDIKDQRRDQQYDLDRPLQLWFYTSQNEKFLAPLSDQGIEAEIPDLVKLYVRSYKLNEYVVRLHNLDEVNSKQVSIYNLKTKNCALLRALAGKAKVQSIDELSWMTTKPKSEVLPNELDPDQPTITHEDRSSYSSISLLPMEIRTFKIVVEADD